MADGIRDKKLLILGANPETTPLVDVANRMGVLTYVTSNRADDAAKQHAHVACGVDGLDVEGLVELVRRERIDGVLVGVADLLVPVYAEVCQRLGLPCYASVETCRMLSQKDEFQRACEEYGLKGIPRFELSADFRSEELAQVRYPLVVKPVDGCSGQGMTICRNDGELRAGVRTALEFSRCKRFLAERYMQCDDVGIYYTFKDGECSVSCLYDRHTTDEQAGLGRVNLGSVYPSKHLDAYYSRVHGKALRMFKSMGIRKGVLLISAFVEDGEFYLYDPGFRLQGEAPHLLMRAIHGFDQREMLVSFALTGSMGSVNLDKEDDCRFRGKSAATLWFLLKPGKIADIRGLDGIVGTNGVMENVQRFREGDEIQPEWAGTEKQVLTRLYLVCDSVDSLKGCIDECLARVRVSDAEGRNMLLKGLNTAKSFIQR